MAPRDTVEIRRFDPGEDIPAFSRLFEEVFHHRPSPGVCRWKYRNPWAERSFSWVAMSEGEMVAHIGAACLPGEVAGREIPFFQLGDIMVHPRYRMRLDYLTTGPRTVLDGIREAHPAAVVYGFTGQLTGRFYKRLGGFEVGAAPDRIFRRGESIPNGAAGEISFEALAWEDPVLDSLWSRHAKDLAPCVRRTRTYLRWRYSQHPLYGYELFGIFRGREPIGWLVVARSDEAAHHPGRELRLQDILLPHGLMAAVLAAATDRFEADALVSWLPLSRTIPQMEDRDSGWVVMSLALGPDLPARDLHESLQYSLGEADEWWW